MTLQGSTKFDSFGSRVSSTVNFFQYRALGNTSSLSRVYFGYLEGTVNESGGEFTYISGENNNTVFPSKRIQKVFTSLLS